MELPSNITKSEESSADVYSGTKEALINAGLVRADQFPPEGTLGISYYSGIPSQRRGVIDNNYLRVEFVKKTWRVRIGVSIKVRDARAIEAHKARKVIEAQPKDAEKRKGEAQYALNRLNELPRTADDFRRKEARAMRHWIQMKLEPLSTERHGFAFDDDATEAIGMASDAIIEAIMAAGVKFDQDKLRRVVERLQVEAIMGETLIAQKVAKLVRPDASVLAGEPS